MAAPAGSPKIAGLGKLDMSSAAEIEEADICSPLNNLPPKTPMAPSAPRHSTKNAGQKESPFKGGNAPKAAK